MLKTARRGELLIPVFQRHQGFQRSRGLFAQFNDGPPQTRIEDFLPDLYAHALFKIVPRRFALSGDAAVQLLHHAVNLPVRHLPERGQQIAIYHLLFPARRHFIRALCR